MERDEDPDAHGTLRFRALREEDLTLLTTWLARPHVAPWWKPALDLDGVRAKYRPRLAGDEPTYMFVIEERGRPVGFIQWYRWADYGEHAARIGAGPTDAGIDLAIGEPDRVGQGLGTDVLRAFVRDIVFADPTIRSCVSDPELANGRSLRAFEKAGFAIERRLPEENRCVVRLGR